MGEITLREISEDTLIQLQRRAQQNRRSVDAEIIAIVEDLLVREKYVRIAKEQGIGSALNAIGRDFNITDEFDNLRERQ